MFETIVCGTTQSDAGRAAAVTARELARRFGSSLHFVTAFSGSADPEMVAPRGGARGRKQTEDFLGQMQTGTGERVHTHALPGDPADAILTVAREVHADAIVVGNKGMHGVHHVLGSVPNTVSHKADCAVMTASDPPSFPSR